jgi:hypothetical protein
MPPIVVINISEQVAPTPARLQETGAIVSQGGTVTSQFTGSLITQPSDLTPLLTTPVTIASVAWSAGVMTVNTAAPHGVPIGQTVPVDWAGCTTASLNATWLMTAATTTQLTFTLAANPGTPTTLGTVVNHSANEILAAVTTFFAQGYNDSIFILELGAGDVNHGVASLATYLTNFPNVKYTAGAVGYYYIYLVPKWWDANANFLTLCSAYEAPSARTYFFVTTTLATYTAYTNLQKSVLALIESPYLTPRPNQTPITGLSWSGNELTITVASNPVSLGEWFQVAGVTDSGSPINQWWQAQAVTATTITVYDPINPGTFSVDGVILPNYFPNENVNGGPPVPSTEFDLAAILWVVMNWNPTDTNKVPPLTYTFLYDVTPFPRKGMSAVIDTLFAANICTVETGAEGGISNAMVSKGYTLDGNSFNFWYATDWCAIEGDLQISNAIINGSNNPVNPLYYNQDGINRLEAVLAGVFSQAVTFGLILYPPKQLGLISSDLATGLENQVWDGFTVINAIPFIPYSRNNPSDYKQGLYRGFSALFTPQLGFVQVQLNFVVSSFAITQS